MEIVSIMSGLVIIMLSLLGIIGKISKMAEEIKCHNDRGTEIIDMINELRMWSDEKGRYE